MLITALYQIVGYLSRGFPENNFTNQNTIYSVFSGNHNITVDLIPCRFIYAGKESTLAEEIANAITSNAQGPKSAQGDSGSVTAHSLPDQIEADKYISAKTAVAAGLWPRRFKTVAPGTV